MGFFFLRKDLDSLALNNGRSVHIHCEMMKSAESKCAAETREKQFTRLLNRKMFEGLEEVK